MDFSRLGQISDDGVHQGLDPNVLERASAQGHNRLLAMSQDHISQRLADALGTNIIVVLRLQNRLGHFFVKVAKLVDHERPGFQRFLHHFGAVSALVERFAGELAAPGLVRRFLVRPETHFETHEIHKALEALALSDRRLRDDGGDAELALDGGEAVVEPRIVLVHFVDETNLRDVIPANTKQISF